MCGGNFQAARYGARDRRFSSFDVNDCFIANSFSANCLESGVTTNTMLNHLSNSFNHDNHLLNYDNLNTNEI
jgi:hypothetical protein